MRKVVEILDFYARKNYFFFHSCRKKIEKEDTARINDWPRRQNGVERITQREEIRHRTKNPKKTKKKNKTKKTKTVIKHMPFKVARTKLLRDGLVTLIV